jgi:hypothetical protein
MVPLHVTIFGLFPPRISDSIAANLSHIGDWYVEEEFSYLRVFRAAVPPLALPQFYPRQTSMSRDCSTNSDRRREQGTESII